MKTKILSILALLLMTVTQGAWAQETLTVYEGTALCPYSPAYINYFDWYTRSQYIIPAANLEAMNGKIITALKYYSNTSNKTSTCNVDVYLKEVGYTTFNSTPTFETKSGIVYRGTVSIAGDGTLTITFTTPYTYNGGNLLIGMENTETDNLNLKYTSFYCQYVNGAVAFGSSGSSLAAVTATRGEFIPKTTFTYETPVPGTPVDLGLPSGKKWADRNVGALSATGYGTYYAWSSSDIATAQWGNDWRMPTLTEAQELINNTDQEWAAIGGVNGTKFMKKTDHSVYIFVPAAGWDGSGNGNIGTAGAYWTSTAQSESRACEFVIRESGNATGNDNMTHQFTIRPVQMFVGEGTQASPYLIASTTDWNNLSAAVNGGETYSGKYFKMTANVGTVSTWMTGTFSGTFDGDGNTLTVGYSATTNNCAPFGYLNGTVQNLKVAGNISTSKQYAGGLAAWVKTGHTANVTNCRVAATINSTYSGDGSSAGFVAYVDGRLNVTGCAFTGTLAGSNAYAWGGFVSYNVGTSVITNCLFAPASVTAKADYSATVGRNGGGTLNFATNFYYTQKFNTAQGMQARTIVKGDGVSSLSVTKGSGTTYNVAGITVYSNGVDYNSTFYGGSGQSVSLALTAETRDGYQFKQYAASQGTLSGQTTNTPTLTMPAANSTANDVVTISAEYDPLYNATFADASDASNGWSISPTSGIVGSTVTVSYEGENKVKSVTVTNKYAIAHSLAESVVGDIVGTDGNAYAVAEKDKLPVGVTAAGVVTYKSGETGIVVALQNCESKYSWDNAFTAAAAYTPAVSGQTWKLGTKDEMSNAILNDYATKYGYITAAGGTFPYPNNYWSATEVSGYTDRAWRIWLNESNVPAWHDWDGVTKATECQVRPIIAFCPKGALTGKFSVSSNKQVQFSKGNLQYVGSWQFAANQYDIFGASQDDDHRDLFGWGTKTNPNNTSTTNGDYSWAEWGENIITNGCTGWRTLTKDEWGYLFTNRANASTLRTFATVNNVEGLIVMPDGWTASGVTLTITTENYTTNVLSTSQWATLEKQGCVFLPAAGGRAGTDVVNVGSIGDYWSSDASGDTNAYDLNFSNNYLLPQNTAGQRHYGWSVRLVRDVELALCSLSEVTNEHVGKIIGADGNVYASLAQAEKVTSAVGVLGKVTETGHGLIMSLEDAPQQVWATIDGWASASYAGTTLKVLPDDDARGSNLPSYTTLGSTTVSNWAVATRADYTAIFTNLGSTGGDTDGISYDANMNAKITGAGGTAISGGNWSSTQYDSSKAWRFDSTWGGRSKTDQYKVRPVLGF